MKPEDIQAWKKWIKANSPQSLKAFLQQPTNQDLIKLCPTPSPNPLHFIAPSLFPAI